MAVRVLGELHDPRKVALLDRIAHLDHQSPEVEKECELQNAAQLGWAMRTPKECTYVLTMMGSWAQEVFWNTN